MYAATIGGQRFVFPRLVDVLARASPLRGGDHGTSSCPVSRGVRMRLKRQQTTRREPTIIPSPLSCLASTLDSIQRCGLCDLDHSEGCNCATVSSLVA